jgi:ribosome-associated protein YbcJ (S4-like RNA binding protein)
MKNVIENKDVWGRDPMTRRGGDVRRGNVIEIRGSL